MVPRLGGWLAFADAASRELHGFVSIVHPPAICGHLEWTRQAAPSSRQCDLCVLSGDSWVHLRMCLTCGYVGCCDSSTNHHATAHFHDSGHPLMRSVEPGERWRWCFLDQVVL
jgi:hypothetical protein